MKTSPSHTIEVINFEWHCLWKLDAELFATLKHSMPRTGWLFYKEWNIYDLIINEHNQIIPISNTQYYIEEKLWSDITKLRYNAKLQQHARQLFAGGKAGTIEIKTDGYAYLPSGIMRTKLLNKDFTIHIAEISVDMENEIAIL